MRVFIAFIAALFVSLVAGCVHIPSQQDDIVVIGDSVMAWNRAEGRDVGSVIGAKLNRPVLNRAAFGAQIRANSFARLLGLSIPAQLPPGRWNWVVANGGANDLGSTCGCTNCDDAIDTLISGDGQTGYIPDLITQALAQNAQVLWLGYYRAPETTSFEGCRPGLVEIERRIAWLAGSDDRVFFLDAETFFNPLKPALLDRDKTHPSVEGSALIGRKIVEVIEDNARD
ncbi:MAG: SGNH/GDSL hydrolase family protein [Roseobacter sp.]